MDYNNVRTVYTAAACNQTPESLDWGRHGLIVYAATNAAIIYDPQQRRVLRTVVQHTARVNTVKWAVMPPTNEAASGSNDVAVTFVTGSDDHSCIVHHIESVFDVQSVLQTSSLLGHTGGVKCVDTLSVTGSDQLLVVTAASDDMLKLWRRVTATGAAATFECFQTIEFNLELCLAVRLCALPTSNGILLAVGAGDTVQLFAADSMSATDDQHFALVQTLSGHEDWVRGLDLVCRGNDVLLASSSQDTFIRLWKAIGAADTASKALHFVLESVLSGHDGWVYSVQWAIDDEAIDGTAGKLSLLSSSMDKTMILWRPADTEHDNDDGIWSEALRVGDIGGHFLGFFGARMAPSRRSLLGHGYHGSFHLWQLDEIDGDGGDGPSAGWRPAVMAAGGHFGEVRDVTWDPSGSYVLSVSADQTTRVHAPLGERSAVVWHELARPQVHGYDMQAIAVLGRYRFASGAEEKIVRTFQAPSEFVRAVRALSGGVRAIADPEGDAVLNFKSKGATLPSLGLSNQPTIVSTADESSVIETPSNDAKLDPPTEETLMQNTLWPETQKLYGHGYEVYALCANADGTLLASACKATSVLHAAIILWNTNTWKQHQRLEAHQLTVTQMRFSPDDRQLLSVSRDRCWSMFERVDENAAAPLAEYRLLEMTNKQNGVHGRIIWTCDWSADSQYFATGSRDGKCVMWHRIDAQHNRSPATSTLSHYTAAGVYSVAGDSVTAVAFAAHTPAVQGGTYLVAVGCETGSIRLCHYSASAWKELHVLSAMDAHHGTVRRLSFRPAERPASETDAPLVCQLASCGNDHFVRVYEITT